MNKLRAGEADSFRKLATEFEQGLRDGMYQSFKISYSRKRRDPLRGPGVPLNIEIQFGDKTS